MAAGNKEYLGLDDLPRSLPVFPLSGALLLPRGQMPLNIFEPRYLDMVDSAMASDRIIGMVQPALDKMRDSVSGLCRVGCAGRIVSFNETGDGRYIITLSGVCRFKVVSELDVITPFRQAEVDWIHFLSDLEEDETKEEVDRGSLLKTFHNFLEANDMEADWESVEQAETEFLVNALSMMSPYGAAEKQALLEAEDLKTRADTLVAITEIALVRGDADNDSVLQ